MFGHYDQFSLGLPPGTDPNSGHGEKNPTYMYCVNVALVEADVTPARRRFSGNTCVSDVGVIGNRLSVEGQAYGGLSHSIGFALSEDNTRGEQSTAIWPLRIPTIDMIPRRHQPGLC